MRDDPDLVAVASYPSLSEAEVAKSLLQAEGIAVLVRDAPLASLLPPLVFCGGGLTLLVAEPEAARAREVLTRPDSAEEPE
jgi:hypothetical protein